jgi:integrase
MERMMAKVRKRTWKNKKGEQTAWIVDYFAPDNKGKRQRHQETFETKKRATERLFEIQHEISQGVHTPVSSSITVAEAGEEWIAQAETDGLEPSTIRQYRDHLDYHIKPLIGTVTLAELTAAGVQKFRTVLIREGRPQTIAEAERVRTHTSKRVTVSRVMAKKILVSLGAILGTAMANGKVARNVVREQTRQHGARQRRLEKRHDKQLEVGVDIPTKEEIRAMLTQVQGRWQPLVVTAIFTGLRASELRGLRWDDVDLDRDVLTVRQRADRWNAIGSPKSDSGKRELPLAPMVVNALKEWKMACPNGEARLVFPNGEGNVESLPNIHRRGLGPLQVAAGITTAETMRAKNPQLTEKQALSKAKLHPKYGLHALRHAAASLFIEQGFAPKRVQTLMGHSTIQVTFDTYGHLFPSQDGDQAAMKQLQARLVG